MKRWMIATLCGSLATSALACAGGQRPRSNRCRLEGGNEVRLVPATPDKWPRVGDACVVDDRNGQIVSSDDERS